jgi:long-chain acyl-CoA synthetase
MDANLAADIPNTLARLLPFVVERYGLPRLLGRCRAEGVAWQSAADVQSVVTALTLALRARGMTPGDRVAIMAETRAEWVVSDLAVLSGGAATVTIYPTLAAEQAAYILRDSGATIAIVSTPAQRDKLVSVRATTPALRTIVVFEPGGAEVEAPDLEEVTLEALLAEGRAVEARDPNAAIAARAVADNVEPDSLATLIYTSGTTGEPKGVMLTHANLVANLQDICRILPVDASDTALSFLPLSHSLERMVIFVYLANGIPTAFAESNDSIGRDLLQVRPTVMTAVPRVFEKLQSRIVEKGMAAGGLKAGIFRWSMGVAAEAGVYVPERRPMPFGLKLRVWLADRLVFRKIREGLGGRFRFVVSGSAALNESVARVFFGVGVPIMEGYGLTETSPVLTVTPLTAVRLGAVGVPLPTVRLRIADDGEILAQGPNIMRGYLNRPEDTADVLRGGWFHTGDIGTIDEDGYLHITDRKKELIVTSGGKKIAPQAIEALLKASPLVSEAVVIGERRHYPAVLLVPDWAALESTFGVARPSDDARVAELLARADVQAGYQAVVDSVNSGLAQYERLKQFRLLPREFSIATGELTPTMKVKRRVIETMYAEQISDIYG